MISLRNVQTYLFDCSNLDYHTLTTIIHNSNLGSLNKLITCFSKTKLMIQWMSSLRSYYQPYNLQQTRLLHPKPRMTIYWWLVPKFKTDRRQVRLIDIDRSCVSVRKVYRQCDILMTIDIQFHINTYLIYIIISFIDFLMNSQIYNR